MSRTEWIGREQAKAVPHAFLRLTVKAREVRSSETMETNLIGHPKPLQTQLSLELIERHIIAARDFSFGLLYLGTFLFGKGVVLLGE